MTRRLAFVIITAVIAGVAQLVEQCFRKAEVGGSNPPSGSINSSEIRIMVVCLLPKQEARVRFSYFAPRFI